MTYRPPADDNALTFGELSKPALPDPDARRRTFEFDPSRSTQELAVLNATNAIQNPQSGLIRFWSHSALQAFQRCPYELFLKRVKKIKQPSSPAAERGNLIQKQAEDYVMGTREHLPEAKRSDVFETRFQIARYLYQQGKVEVEQTWGFDADWNPIAANSDKELYRNEQLWCITKLDLFIREDQTSARIIDHKSGKKFGNEAKHGAQAMEYVISAFMRYPELEVVYPDFWYLDQGQDMPRKYTREEAMILLPRVTERAIKMTTAQEFPPQPSQSNCRWCYYKDSGDCEYASEE